MFLHCVMFNCYFREGNESKRDSQHWASKYAKMGEKMFHNMPKNIVVAGRVVRQKVMVTLAVGGEKRGGKLSCSGLGRRGISMYFCITRMDGWARGAHLLCNP